MAHDPFRHRAAIMYGALFCIIALAGCDDDSNPVNPQDQDLAALQQAVQGFGDLSVAEQAGYTTIVGDPTDGHTCLFDPQLGAMGVHYLKAGLVDDTVIVTQPEAAIYEPQQDGSLQFVGVEYVIPYALHGADQAPPELFGQQFSKMDAFQLWGLHVWVARDNPSGKFAMWNPNVSCQFGQ